jgi:hypothetical protein
MKSGDVRLTSTKPSLVKIAVVVVAVSAEAAVMAAIVVDAAATAAVLATNFCCWFSSGDSFTEKPPGTSNGPEAFV